MMDALRDIPFQAPPSGTWGSRPPRRDLVAELREKVREAQRREAAAAALPAAPPAASSDAKRPRSESGPPTEPKRLKMTEAPKRPGPKNFQDIWQFKSPPKCFLQVGPTRDFLIGATANTGLGYCVKTTLDGGVYGEPSISVTIGINTTGKDLEKAEYDTFCTLTWEPGVKVNGKWMIDAIDSTWMTAPGLSQDIRDVIFPPEVLADQKSRFQQANLMAVSIKSNICRSSKWDPRWTDKLAVATAHKVKSTMAELLHPKDDGTRITFVFVPPMAGALGVSQHIISYLKEATIHRFPPFVQYMDEENKPLLDYSLQTIDAIGDGMYVNHATRTLATGQHVKDVAGRKTYRTMDLRYNWNAISSFAIMQGVPVVRDMQHARGLHAPLEKAWHRIFLQTLPVFQADGRAIKIDSKMDHSFWAGVRVNRDPVTGLKEDVPEPGTTIILNINTADVNKPPVRDPKNPWYGRVQAKDRVWHQTNGTDFCIFVTKPRTSRIDKGNFFTRNKMVEDKLLVLAKFEVKTNLTPQTRKLDAFKKFCDEEFHGALLDEMRLAFWAQPNRADPDSFADLTLGPKGKTSAENQKKYMQHVQDVKARGFLNASQETVLKSPCKMRRNINCVAGPAGAGKSKTIANEMIGLTKIGHKIACVAGSDVAVDANAAGTWLAMSDNQRTGPDAIKMLRLETDAAEKAARLSKMSYADYAGIPEEELGNPSEYVVPELAQDNPAIRNTLERIVSEFAIREKAMATFLQKYEDVDEAYKALKKVDTLRKSIVPVAMTLDYRIWEIVDKSKREAEAEYKKAREAMGPEEFSKRFEAGEISVDHFDKCAGYRTYMANYMTKRGKLTRTERSALEDEHDRLVSQVLKETDILFATCSNAGGELLTMDKSFSPTMIFCDEAGQVSIPELCVPLTTFTNWEGLVLVGDCLQLKPTIKSSAFNEFIRNAGLSPLALLQGKGFPSILLDEQYRMAPALSAFPRAQFYDGNGLKDSQKVMVDNDVRKVIRDWSFTGLGARGANGKGTEYLMVDVPYGCSRLEPNGTSLVNYANAIVVINIIDRLLTWEAITPKMFKVLCYYKGQVRLINRFIREKADWEDSVKKAIVVTTIESFQGKEGQIVILDTVVARDILPSQVAKGKKPANDNVNAESNHSPGEDHGEESYIREGRVTKYVRNPNRLNFGLTRGMDSTIVLCQKNLLHATIKVDRGKRYNCLANMVADAEQRRCVVVHRQIDMHPDAVSARQWTGAVDMEQARKADEEAKSDFIQRSRRFWHKVRKEQDPTNFKEPELYHTSKGVTTRPIGNPDLAARADKYDKEVAEQKRPN